jgi:oligopeptide/dipeptide ABC transporter ATP-binding protein
MRDTGTADSNVGVAQSMAPVVEAIDLKKHFSVRAGWLRSGHIVRAVDGMSFQLYPGETLGLVGESGSGKSTVARLVLRLMEPTAGRILFRGRDLAMLTGNALHEVRRELQIVFQDPYSSLNPRRTVEQTLMGPLEAFRLGDRAERNRRVTEILDLVGLARAYRQRYPHQLSGGQRQRVGIARALILRPSLLVADEPVSALDVSVQAQVLNLLRDLQRTLQLSELFIAHNLAVVQYVSDRIAVMYLGKLVEVAARDALFREPLHPYTQALLSAAPTPDPTVARRRHILGGEVPNPIQIPSGCRFHPRCPYAEAVCQLLEPPLEEVTPRHFAACHMFSRDPTVNHSQRRLLPAIASCVGTTDTQPAD